MISYENNNNDISVSRIPHKISETFLCLSIVSVHQKQNGARLLSPEVECTSCWTT